MANDIKRVIVQNRYTVEIYGKGGNAAVDLGPDRLNTARERALVKAARDGGASRLVIFVEGTTRTIDIPSD